MTVSHCRAVGCGRRVAAGMPFCGPCFALVPEAMKPGLRAAHARLVAAIEAVAVARGVAA